MDKDFSLTHERVDDIPLLFGLMVRLRLPELFDRFLGNHGLHQGLSNGWLATIWLIFILSEGDHRKSSVRDWVERHHQVLERLLEQAIRPVDFTDDRLGIVLRRLSKTGAWEALEAELWANTVAVYDLPIGSVRLDSTTAYGYHTPNEDGIMQRGQSKDHRPDLAQLKLMAAALEPSGHPIACDVLPGHRSDGALYRPVIARVRRILERSGLLYTGDCKMSARATRADLVAHGDYYLVPLTEENKPLVAEWINAIVSGEQSAELIRREECLLGAGYALQRPMSVKLEDQEVHWVERVLVVRSQGMAERQNRALMDGLRKGEAALWALTRAPRGRKRAYQDEASLRAAIAEIEKRFHIEGLLKVTWQREETTLTRYLQRGRGGPDRPKRTEVRVRYVITSVQRDEQAIEQRQYRLGWRIYVTNVLQEEMNLTQAVLHYRSACSLERDYHLVKDRPLGISPLYVRNDDQIIGLTRLLTVALRFLTLIETQVRQKLAEAKAELAGLFEGQPNRTTARPTATRILRAFAREEITLTRIEFGSQCQWHITPLSELQTRILAYLGLPAALYGDLSYNST